MYQLKTTRMKLFSFLLAGFLVCFVPRAFAQEITVVTEDIAPFIFFDKKEQRVSGSATEMVVEILKRAKLTHRIEIYPWARSYMLAQRAPNVAIYSMTRTPEREKMFKWVGAVEQRDPYLFRLKSRPEINAKTFADLKPFFIGGIRDDATALYLAKEGLHIDYSSNDAQNLRKLMLKRIDALVIDDQAINYVANVEKIDSTEIERFFKLDELSGPLFLAFSLSTPDDIVMRCKSALMAMVQDGTYQQITQKWNKKAE